VAKTPSPDYGRDLGKLEGSVDVLKQLTFAVIGILTVIVGGGIALFVQIHSVSSDLEMAKTELSGRLARVEGAAIGLTAGQSDVSGSLSRIEKRIAELAPLPQSPVLTLSSDDRMIIRTVLKFDPDQAYKGIGHLGDALPDAKLFDYPDELLSKIPALKGTRYTFDAKGQLLIVSLAEQRVIAIV